MRLQTLRLISTAIAAAFLACPAAAGPAQPRASPVERAGQLIAEAQASFAASATTRARSCARSVSAASCSPSSSSTSGFASSRSAFASSGLRPSISRGRRRFSSRGKNNNEIRAKGTGLLAIAGYVSLPTNDPRVMKNSRHSITETGIGNMIEIISRSYEIERRLPANQVKVTFADYAFQQKPCTRMEVTHLVFQCAVVLPPLRRVLR